MTTHYNLFVLVFGVAVSGLESHSIVLGHGPYGVILVHSFWHQHIPVHGQGALYELGGGLLLMVALIKVRTFVDHKMNMCVYFLLCITSQRAWYQGMVHGQGGCMSGRGEGYSLLTAAGRINR